MYDRNELGFVTGKYNSGRYSQAKQRPKRYPYESSRTKHLASVQCLVVVVKVRSTKHRSIHRKRNGIVDVEANDSREEDQRREGLGKGGLFAPIEELSVLLKSGASSDTVYDKSVGAPVRSGTIGTGPQLGRWPTSTRPDGWFSAIISVK